MKVDRWDKVREFERGASTDDQKAGSSAVVKAVSLVVWTVSIMAESTADMMVVMSDSKKVVTTADYLVVM